MAIHVDEKTEKRFRETMQRWGYRSEDEFLEHLLALEDHAQRQLDEIILGNEDEIRVAIDEGMAQLERGEFFTGEESRARLAALREREMKRSSEAA
jgi:predicted transcriptional regulator